MAGMLYVVGTPIGNLGDLTDRQKQVLAEVDFIAAEDTRVSVKLLNHLGIKKPMVSYYEHNLRERGQMIADRILSGENCAVVSDAGMPCISDPGEDLVRLCAAQGIAVTAVPGPSAAITALCLSGLSTSRFRFEGFLSTNKRSRAEHLESVRSDGSTLIFYEAPHKLLNTLQDMLRVLGDRRVSIARELTKLHEEVLRVTLSEAVEHFTQNPPRGEFVLVVEGAQEQPAEEWTLGQAAALAQTFVEEGMKPSEAAKEAAKQSGYRKSEIYSRMMEE